MRTQPDRRSVGRPPGRVVDPVVRREELLDAASRVIRRRGVAASMDELAAEAGLTKPILYACFGDRAGLAEALAERYVNQVAERLAATLTPGRSPKEMLHDAFDAFVGFVEEEPLVYQFLVREAVNAAASGKTVSIARLRIFDSLGALITAALAHQLQQFGRDPAVAEPIAFATMGMVFSAAEWWLDRRTITRAELVDILTDLTWTGLRGQPSA
jgi:AcrR family transcriptional regulator